MWSARWGHAVTVIDQISAYRNDLSLEENSERAETLVPKLIVLGGDDYGFSEFMHIFTQFDRCISTSS